MVGKSFRTTAPQHQHPQRRKTASSAAASPKQCFMQKRPALIIHQIDQLWTLIIQNHLDLILTKPTRECGIYIQLDANLKILSNLNKYLLLKTNNHEYYIQVMKSFDCIINNEYRAVGGQNRLHNLNNFGHICSRATRSLIKLRLRLSRPLSHMSRMLPTLPVPLVFYPCSRHSAGFLARQVLHASVRQPSVLLNYSVWMAKWPNVLYCGFGRF